MRNKYRGADIRARLSHTIIRYRGQPYHCVIDGEDVCLEDIITRRVEHRVSAEDPNLDISSLTLGYFNIGDAAVYLTRNPLRRYKQGVELGALSINTLSNTVRYGHADMFCQGFVDGINDRYPTLKKALWDLTHNKVHSKALSKDAAIRRDKELIKVHVKNEEVGWMKLGTNRVLVPPTEMSWASKIILEDVSNEWEIIEGVK